MCRSGSREPADRSSAVSGRRNCWAASSKYARSSGLRVVRRFGGWHDPIPAIVAEAAPDRILRHDVHHIAQPLPAFHRGRVALLGDAAHAMPPTLGQGGNQAIEDAVVLAHHAPPGAAPGLAAYTRDRLPRTTDVTRRAVRVTRLNMLRNRPAVALRDAALRAVGALGPALMLRGMDGIADWRPPQRRPYATAGAHRTAP
ncbi:FAD-dependent monooxygenase [Streptomyces beihaiensis]|uniref:FAD-dependent monooxygenase n=1 Tax=Streptomyces beihaiensis TaxID=2984495 RepID=UPI003899E932